MSRHVSPAPVPLAASLAASLALLLALAGPAALAAQSSDFESFPVGTPTPLTITGGGNSAAFSSIAPTPFTAVDVAVRQGDIYFPGNSVLSGNALAAFSEEIIPTQIVDIDLAFPVYGLSFSFVAVTNPSITVDLYFAGGLVGTLSTAGTPFSHPAIPAGANEGIFSYLGATAFDQVRLGTSSVSTSAAIGTAFGIDDIRFDGTPTTAPEPGSVALVATGLLAVAGGVRRRG